MDVAKIYTIGHSNHSWALFLALLQARNVAMVADVRSVPRSRFAHFGKERLQRGLGEAAIAYVYLGGELGGRPQDAALYGSDGALDLAAVRRRGFYRQGLARVLALAREASGPLCLMCAEENPAHCHRTLLLVPDLTSAGAEILHIRKGDAS